MGQTFKTLAHAFLFLYGRGGSAEITTAIF